MATLIGITGRAGAGKNTLAEAIVSAMGGGEIVGFGDTLRDVVEAAFGSRYETQESKAAVDEYWDRRLVGPGDSISQKLGDRQVTGRRILQFFGTEIFRNLVHPDFWLFTMERRLAQPKYQQAPVVVIADVRFENEASFIRRRGGEVIEIMRADQRSTAAADHASEAGLPDSMLDRRMVSTCLEETHLYGKIIANHTRRSKVTGST